MASEEKVPCKHAECTARTTFTGEQPLYSKSGRKKHHRKLNYHPCCDGDGKLCEQGQRIKICSQVEWSKNTFVLSLWPNKPV